MARVLHSYGQGRVDVFPFTQKDYNEIVRLCLVKRDKYKKGSLNYYRWYRNYMMMILGCNTGCRIEVLLQLTPKHLLGGRGRIQEYKTEKIQRVDLNSKLTKAVEEYLDYLGIGDREYIFRSSKNTDKPLTRVAAYQIIKKLAAEAGVKYAVGCHSLRKSYGRFAYDATHDLLMVQRMLGHSNPMITQQYICLEEDKVSKFKSSLQWGLDI